MSRNLTAVPAAKSSARALRIKQNIIIGLILLGFLAGPFAFLRARGETTVVNGSNQPTKTIAAAEIVAYDYLGSRPTEMPAAAGVDPSFGLNTFEVEENPLEYSDLTFYSSSPIQIGNTAGYLVRFVLEFPDNTATMFLSIPMTTDPVGRPLLGGTPSLAPAVFAANDTYSGFSLERNLRDESIPVKVEERVQLWAEAYASDNGQDLRVLVNDIDAPAGGEYFGLGGFTCANSCVDVLWAAPSDAEPGSVWVRAAVVFTRDGANGFEASQSFDLLVRGWNTDAPRVMSWGPVGSGPTLIPYTNNTANL